MNLRHSPRLVAAFVAATAAFVSPVHSQVQSGVQSNVQSGTRSRVHSGQYYLPNSNSHRTRYPPAYSNCWRTTVIRNTRVVWNCQPYPPP
jgi:hypothetical protein